MIEPMEAGVLWTKVWNDVARQLGAHREVGRAHLLTEDSVRLCTVLALESVGIQPAKIAVEVPDSALLGGKLDLVVEVLGRRTVVELKYPRGSRSGISPDTMTLGELVRDFLRVALVPADDRWVVLVAGSELRRYLCRREGVGWAETVGGRMTWGLEVLQALPKTATDAIGKREWLLPVTATCDVAMPIGVDLALFAYRVDPPPADSVPTALAPGGPMPHTSILRDRPSSPSSTRGGARAAIVDAVQALAVRSGHSEVTIEEVVGELRRSGTPYAESTIRTMMSSHMCAQVDGPGIGSHDDLDRVGRGLYRLR